MTFGLKMTVKNLFFDRALVAREVGKANAKALSKAGAFVQRRARSSMRRRKKSSAPGTPPSAHAESGDTRSLKKILFAYDNNNQSVVVGPLRLNGEQGSVPALHEFGGTRPRDVVRIGNRWQVMQHGHTRIKGKWTFVGDGKRQVKKIQARYPARPFMGPALAAEAPKFPSLWAGSVGASA